MAYKYVWSLSPQVYTPKDVTLDHMKGDNDHTYL